VTNFARGPTEAARESKGAVVAAWYVALVREQGVDFGVVLVADSAVEDPGEQDGRDQLCQWWALQLLRPVVLLGEQRFRCYGRRDIVAWLADNKPSQLPWQKIVVPANSPGASVGFPKAQFGDNFAWLFNAEAPVIAQSGNGNRTRGLLNFIVRARPALSQARDSDLAHAARRPTGTAGKFIIRHRKRQQR
jgi:hypothetical protein